MTIKSEIKCETVLLEVGLDNTGEEPIIDGLWDAKTGKEINYDSLDEVDQARILWDAMEELVSSRMDEAAHRLEDWTISRSRGA
jgi:hypothetical protein